MDDSSVTPCVGTRMVRRTYDRRGLSADPAIGAPFGDDSAPVQKRESGIKLKTGKW
jgi:hypothetical protein